MQVEELAELEEAIGRSEDEYYIRGFTEGQLHGLLLAETKAVDIRKQRDWLLKEVRESYGD